MSKSVKTRVQYKIVGSDYSAQEPRLTTFLSGDEAMRQAYLEGKDLYCVIASSIFNNKYEDNLENYPEGTEIELDGHITIAGSGKEIVKTITDTLEVPYFYLIPTPTGDKQASLLKEGDLILTNEEELIKILKIERIENNIKIYF